MSKLTTSMDNKPLLGVDHLDNKLGVDHLEAMSKNREVSIAIKEEEENGRNEQKEEENGNNLMEGDKGKKNEEEEEVKKEEVDVNETDDHASSDTSGLLTTHL